jgi:hypothetical protein
VNSTYTIGPLSSSLNSFGEYSSGSSALTVNAMVPNDGSTFEIAVADAPYPCLGAAVGFASTSNDLLPGSANYVVLTPVASGMQLPIPQARSVLIEAVVPSGMASVAGSAFADAANAMGANVTSTVTSALWKLDASTGTLIPTWKNSDGSNAVATFVYDWDAEAMLLVGNLSMFIATMNANVTNIVSVLCFIASHH